MLRTSANLVKCVLLRKVRSPLEIYNSEAPFEILQMDILGPFSVSTSGNKYLLVLMDFTKWIKAFSLKNIRAGRGARESGDF